MKVFMIPSWYPTEDKPMNGIFFQEQAQALAQAGAEVCVLYPDLRFRLGGLRRGIYKTGSQQFDTYICRRRSLTPYLECGRWPQRAAMLEKLYRAAEREHGRPDVLHLHACRMGVEALALSRRHGLPLVYTEHYSGLLAPKAGLTLQYVFRKTLKGCTAALAVSRALLEKMRPLRPDAQVVPNLVDTGRFSPQPRGEGEGFVFAAMGNLVPVKNYGLLIEAFARALPEMPGARLLIAGDGPERGRLMAAARALGADGRVEFCGIIPREKAPAFFAGIDCLVCSSKRETFGMTLIEALACGRPVVATRCGGPEDILTPQNGLLVENDDAERLVLALREMYRGAGRYDPVQISGDCARRFGSGAVAARLMAIYAKAAGAADRRCFRRAR